MDINIKRIPSQLKSRPQWVCWKTTMRNGKETKLPVNPSTGSMAKSDDPSSWGSMMDAVSAFRAQDDLKGIGFMFSDDDPYVGVDLDDCRDAETGEWEQWALDILEDLDGFKEISPSGTGAHAILPGKIPGGRNRKGSVEMYEELRYFTVTGDVIDDAGEPIDSTPELVDCQRGLDAVYERFLADEEDESDGPTVNVDLSGLEHLDLESHRTGQRQSYSAREEMESLSEEEQELINKAKTSRNGYKFTQLWRGQWEDVYPSESQSEADMGFCDMLAFWASGDPERMDRMFRASGLIRPKWDDKHYSDGSTYGERTIQRAMVKVDDHYDPNHFEEVVEEQQQLDTRLNGDRPSTTSESTATSADTGREPNKGSETETTKDESDDVRTDRRSRGSTRPDPTGLLGSPEPSSDDASEATPSEGENAETTPSRTDDSKRSSGDSAPETGNEKSRRRTRSGRDEREFEPVNVGSASPGSPETDPVTEGGIYSDMGESSSATENETDDTPTDPTEEDHGSIFDRDHEAGFDSDEFVDDVDEEGEKQEIDRKNAEGMYGDEDNSASSEKNSSEEPSATRERATDRSSAEPEDGSNDGGDEFSDTEKEDEDTDAEGEDNKSKSGNKEIPTEVETRIQDLNIAFKQLSEEVDAIDGRVDGEVEHADDLNRTLLKEVKHYEEHVERLETRIEVYRYLLTLVFDSWSDKESMEIADALHKRDEQRLVEILQIEFEEVEGSSPSEWLPRGPPAEQAQRERNRKTRKTSDLNDPEDETGSGKKSLSSLFF